MGCGRVGVGMMFKPGNDDIIRSSFCAEGVRAGTRLFLVSEGESFLVASRFQNIGRRKRIEDATALFERTLVGGA